MAQKFLSPGVFTEEIDQSFLAQGVAGVGAIVLGLSPKGPAIVPTLCRGLDDVADIFGKPQPGYPALYAAKNYLKNADALTFVRILGHADGTTNTNGYTLGAVTGISDAQTSGSILAVIHHSGSHGVVTVAGVALDANKFTITIGSAFAATASFLTSSAEYIEKVMNTDLTKYSTYGHYLSEVYKYTPVAASASWAKLGATGAPTSFAKDFASGSAVWVKSQPVGGLEFNLFRFHSLKHGRATNDEVKVTVANVKPSPNPTATPYGTFDLLVRRFYDTDQRPEVLETFTQLSLDPDSPSYLPRRIGDAFEEFDTTQRKFVRTNNYANKSRFVRVEMNTADNYPPEALPWGHRGYARLTFVSASAIDDMTLSVNQIDRNGNLDPNIAWGISFVSGGIVDRMRAFPAAGHTTANDTEFSLSRLSGTYVSGKIQWSYVANLAAASYHQAVYSSASLYKFTMPIQGGFDGFDLRVADPLYLANGTGDTDIGVTSAKRALDAVANPDAFDYNVLAVPNVHNLKVTDKARQVVNDRRDAMYVMDVTGSSVTEAVQGIRNRELDDNYTATYYPDLKLNDRANSRTVRVSPSVAILGALAFNDRVGQPFFAPAGLNRGGLGAFDIVDVVDRLTYSDRNDLYDNRINPIATFPNEGIVVFGQKTLQVKSSALDRINVRRLLIFAKKTISAAAKTLLFEPNNASTWQRFTNLVNPILERIRQDQGIERFRVVMDTTTNTPDVVDRNTMVGKIFLQPTRSAEFIDLSFIITNAGVQFGE